MAILVGETLPVPGFADANGRGTNNGGGTFSYSGPSGTGMAYIQAAGAGGAGDPIPTPFNGTKTYTVEARFKVSGDRNNDASNHDYFAFEHNASNSSTFSLAYGRQGSDGNGTITISPVGGDFTSSAGTIPLGYGNWITMRVTSQDTGGGAALLSSFIDLDDGNGWRIGPSASHTPNPNRNRGALVRALSAGGAESGALGAPNAPSDPDLAAVVDAWPALSEVLRAAILAMVRGAK